jgi:outer membrane protein assembly factor BamA
MLSTKAALVRDTRSHPHLPDSGGLQSFEAVLNEGLSGGDFSYWSYRGDIQHFLPLSSDNRKVIALRATVETNLKKGGSAIPFFDLPIVGGSSTVRGFETRRFTDSSAMSLSAEYRYRIGRNFDWGLFIDAGQVAPQLGDFGLNRFHKGYGMRLILRTAEKRAVFVDFAHSREEPIKFYLNLSPLF